MLTSRSTYDLRVLAGVAATACVLCAPMLVGCSKGSAPSATASKTTTVQSTAVAASHATAAPSASRIALNEQVQKMAERLKLTGDQAAKVTSILHSRAVRMWKIRATFDAHLGTPEN